MKSRIGPASRAAAAEQIDKRRDDGAPEPGREPRRAAVSPGSGSSGRMPPGSGVNHTVAMPTSISAGHQRVGEAPAAKARGVERAGRGGEHAEAIAPLRRGGAGALLLGPQQLDAVGVDDDVLARRQKGDDDRGERGQPGIGSRIGEAEREDRRAPAPAGSPMPSRAAARAARSGSGSATGRSAATTGICRL